MFVVRNGFQHHGNVSDIRDCRCEQMDTKKTVHVAATMPHQEYACDIFCGFAARIFRHNQCPPVTSFGPSLQDAFCKCFQIMSAVVHVPFWWGSKASELLVF